MAQSAPGSTNPETYWTAELFRAWGVSMINADYAYARGVDGSGIEVGVIDSGVSVDHPELQGQIAGGYDYAARSPVLTDVIGHGTAVASIIAGKRDGVGIHGVAPGARIVSARVFDDAGWIDDDATIVGEAWSDMLDRGVRILNNSWGAVDYELAERSAETVESLMPRILAASRSSVERGGLLIFITHNEGLSQPNLESSLPYLFPELERGWLAVTAVGLRALASYANACGVAKAWCLAAPGGDWADGFGLPVAGADGGYGEVVGTSYAAPHVAGAAALVWQMFPDFTADQVRQTLLGTATDIGAAGVDDLYGYGLLDAGRAVQGPGRFDWGDFHVVQRLGVSNWYNDIVGSGGLIKSGPGTLVLHGDNAYTGSTRVNEGLLAVVGAIASPTFIGYDGAIAGHGTVRGSVWNEGYIGPGDPWLAGELTFEGDFVNTPTGVIVGQVAPGGLTNKLVVAGSADLEGGAVEVVVTPGLYRSSFTQALLSAGEGVHGSFNEVVGEDYAFLKPSLSYDAGAVYLTLTRLPFDDRSVCAGVNACAVGGALERGLDTGDADVLSGATALQGLSTGGAQASLAGLSGEAHASLASIALRGGAPLGLSARLTELRTDGVDQGAWVRGYGQWGRVGSDPDAAGADHRVGGVMAGSDWQISPNLRLGASFGYSSTDVDFDRFDGKGEIKTYEGGLYGVYSRGPFGLDSWLSYAALSTEVGRTIVIGPETGRAVADYDGDRIAAFAEASYLIDLGGVAARPLGSLRYVALRQEGFSEQGVGGLGLAAAAQSLDSLEGGVGLGLSAPLGVREATGKIEARAKWMHEFLDDRGELDAAFIGAPTASFTSRGPRMSRDSALLGLGVVAQAGKAVEIFANYDARLSTTGAAHAAGAGLRITW